ncbi:MAG: hypothetical protein ACE5HX_09035 [bacterium]
MSEIITENKIKSTIQNILHDAGLASEDQALKNQARMIALSRVNKYESEISNFQNKYEIVFAEFEKQLKKQKNEESFECEDDYLDWKFAVEALKVWKERIKILNHA